MGEAAVHGRPAVEGNREFCWELHVAGMREHVERLWGWHEAEQRVMFDERFDAGGIEVLGLDGRPVGELRLVVRPGELFLSRLVVHPEHQGRGIGTAVVTELLASAAASGSAVALSVLRGNRAVGLYRRLGFGVVRQDEDRVWMRIAPA